jgi:hypothetical protein
MDNPYPVGITGFNQNSSDFHHEAADRVIKYLYSTKNLYIQYGHDNSSESFICVGKKRPKQSRLTTIRRSLNQVEPAGSDTTQ